MLNNLKTIKINLNTNDANGYKGYLQNPKLYNNYNPFDYPERENNLFKKLFIFGFCGGILLMLGREICANYLSINRQECEEQSPIKALKVLIILGSVYLTYLLFRDSYLHIKYINLKKGVRQVHNIIYDNLLDNNPEIFSELFQDHTLILGTENSDLQVKLSDIINLKTGYERLGQILKLIAQRDELLKLLVLGMHDKQSNLSKLNAENIAQIFQYCTEDLGLNVEKLPLDFTEASHGIKPSRLKVDNLVKAKESKLPQEVIFFSKMYHSLTTKKALAAQQEALTKENINTEEVFDLEAQAFLPLGSKIKLM